MNDCILSFTQYPNGLLINMVGGVQKLLTIDVQIPLSGIDLYQSIFTDLILMRYREQVPDRLLLYVPPTLLDWPWQTLHDGVQLLVLYHPIIVLPLECLAHPMPNPCLKTEQVNILVTFALDKEHEVLGEAIEQMVKTFAKAHQDQVVLVRERYKYVWQLLDIFQNSPRRFQVWHHVGPCTPDFALTLPAGEPRHVRDLNHLLKLQEDIRCFVFSTNRPLPAASKLGALRVPFTFCQSMTSMPETNLVMLQGFYRRLLTHDLAAASTLGLLEYYLDTVDTNPDVSAWAILARTPKLMLERALPANIIGQQQTPVEPLKTLILKANPPRERQNDDLLLIENEVREIKFALLGHERSFDLHEEGAVRLQDISRFLRQYKPRLLHFSGHADTEMLILENYAMNRETSLSRSVSPRLRSEGDGVPFAAIAALLAEYRSWLRCVVFSACETEALAEMVCEQIDCAIGMRGAIKDSVAIRFSELFYRALAAGESVGGAFRQARTEVRLFSPGKYAEIFQLKNKPGINPDEFFL